MQLRIRHIARNVLFNWFGTIANMAVGFFLSPFILHRLGNVAYGVWVLAVSVVAYLNLLDLGMQNSVLRFVAKGYTQKDHKGASEIFSAAFWVRVQISVLVLLLSCGLSAVFPFIFKIPPDLATDARKAILLIGAAAATSMSIGVFGGVLSALNRYDLQNYARLAQTAVRVVGVVTVLLHGKGIVAIALCELVAAVVGNLLLVWGGRKLYPELRVHFNVPRRETLRTIWSYSIYVFITGVATQLINQTDIMVVGAFISTSAVTSYAIANSLCRYADQIISSMGTTFVPAASTYEADGNANGLLMLYTNGTRAMLAVSLPTLITLTVRGSSFIGLWMGAQYARTSGFILVILSCSLLLGFTNRTAGAIAFGIGKHKPVALFAIGEGIVNLGLSILLVHRYGLYGVAVGTLLPSMIVHLVLWPGYISRLAGLGNFALMWRVGGTMYLASIPFALVSYAVDRLFPVHNLAIFFLQVIATLPVFLLTVALIFRTSLRVHVLPKVRSLFLVRET